MASRLVPDVPSEIAAGHAMPLEDSGLTEMNALNSSQSDFSVRRITSRTHDRIAAMRDETSWKGLAAKRGAEFYKVTMGAFLKALSERATPRS